MQSSSTRSEEIEAARYQTLRCFVLFIGYQQSGHSVLGALLDAHMDALVAHELGVLQQVKDGDVDRVKLFRAILDDSRKQVREARQSYGYSYYIEDSWQGKFRLLRAIGDKHGGNSTALLARQPELLDKLRATVQLPVRVLHVVRNPYDNVASMSLRGLRTLDECARRYATSVNNVRKVRELLQEGELLDIRQETLLARPKDTMAGICRFLKLEPQEAFLDLCAKHLFSEPNRKRDEVYWDPVTQVRMRQIIEGTPWLSGYSFEK